MSKQRLSYYDDVYSYKGYVLVNDRYEDAEGFYKNGWQWGKEEDMYVVDPVWLEGLSSNSYAQFAEAVKKFRELIDKMS